MQLAANRESRGEGELGVRDHVLGVMILGVALLACGGGLSKDIEPPEVEQASFVFGHLDMEEASTDVDVVTFERLAPRTDENFYNFRVDDGTFYAEYIPPGSYVLDGFSSAGGMFSQPTRYAVPRQDNPIRLTIREPGVYYVGTWKYLEVETGFFEAGKFDITPVGTPTAKQLVQVILPHAEDTNWHEYLTKYAATLP
jgi:hypothetical protein